MIPGYINHQLTANLDAERTISRWQINEDLNIDRTHEPKLIFATEDHTRNTQSGFFQSKYMI